MVVEFPGVTVSRERTDGRRGKCTQVVYEISGMIDDWLTNLPSADQCASAVSGTHRQAGRLESRDSEIVFKFSWLG